MSNPNNRQELRNIQELFRKKVASEFMNVYIAIREGK